MDDQTSPLTARSVPQYCKAIGISPALFYKKRKALLEAGKPDPITKIGARSIITVEKGRAFLDEPMIT